jgi:hypothetical protein
LKETVMSFFKLRAVSFATLGLALFGALLFAVPAHAQLAAPADRPILRVTGNIQVKNTADAASLDLKLLQSAGISKVTTSTPWTNGKPTFEGVLLRDLLKLVGAKGETVTAVALNDYKVTIPIADFEKYPVLLAYSMNGERLKVREKGPLWIIYPRDDYPELDNKPTQAKWVWQIKEIHVN